MEESIEEIEKLQINWEKGFYLEFRDGKLHVGKNPLEGIEGLDVIEV